MQIKQGNCKKDIIVQCPSSAKLARSTCIFIQVVVYALPASANQKKYTQKEKSKLDG